jgi:hypothetical protein
VERDHRAADVDADPEGVALSVVARDRTGAGMDLEVGPELLVRTDPDAVLEQRIDAVDADPGWHGADRIRAREDAIGGATIGRTVPAGPGM